MKPQELKHPLIKAAALARAAGISPTNWAKYNDTHKLNRQHLTELWGQLAKLEAWARARKEETAAAIGDKLVEENSK